MLPALPSVKRPAATSLCLCLPVSKPPASGLYGITAMPSSWQSGSRSRSKVRNRQIVARLHRRHARKVLHFGTADGARKPEAHPVGHADIARLAGAHDRVERFQRFVERRRRIEAVQLIEIDIVRLEALQRRVDGIQDVLARHALVPTLRSHAAHAFGGKDVFVAPALQPAAHDLFGAPDRRDVAAQRIDVGRVEEIDAAVGGRVEDGVALGLVALQTEGHGAEAEAGNCEAGAAEGRVFHGGKFSPAARARPAVTSMRLRRRALSFG